MVLGFRHHVNRVCVSNSKNYFPAMEEADNVTLRKTKRERVAENRVQADAIRARYGELKSQQKIAVDCSFAGIMNDQERSSLAVQLQECYSHLRNFGAGDAQMFIGSASSELVSTLHAKGGENWAVHIREDSVESIASSLDCSLIIMSPDASEELTPSEVLDINTVFVIGGIVDRVVSKNETAHKAIRIGAKARRLPMDPGFMRNRVLNIDTVFMFLVRCFKTPDIDRRMMIELLVEILPERKKALSKPSSQVAKMTTADTHTPERGNTTKLDRYSVLDLFR
jgi:hypothetical protein